MGGMQQVRLCAGVLRCVACHKGDVPCDDAMGGVQQAGLCTGAGAVPWAVTLSRWGVARRVVLELTLQRCEVH
eukprot:1160281-Pelagomonas_calceolata.AAC.10